MADRKFKNPVNSQMGSHVPSMDPPQSIHTIKAPFDKPHDMGNGGIPLKVQETIGSGSTGTKVSSPGMVGGLASVPASGPKRSVEKAAPPSNKK